MWLVTACTAPAKDTTPAMNTAPIEGTAPAEETPKATNTFKVSVTAYCLRGKSASGLTATTGMAAADPDVLPLGSQIRLRAISGGTAAREGTYTILDRGSKVQGRHIDLYFSNCSEATRFGRRSMIAEVLRRGWGPDTAQAPTPTAHGANALASRPRRDGSRLP
jgi:3D (Asp-Asp-Asp) domain-containing protein